MPPCLCLCLWLVDAWADGSNNSECSLSWILLAVVVLPCNYVAMDQRVHGVYRTLFDASFVFFLPNLLGSASAIEMENSFFGQLYFLRTPGILCSFPGVCFWWYIIYGFFF
jgi:hypothetical protein